jgi:hypothetical protein
MKVGDVWLLGDGGQDWLMAHRLMEENKAGGKIVVLT